MKMIHLSRVSFLFIIHLREKLNYSSSDFSNLKFTKFFLSDNVYFAFK